MSSIQELVAAQAGDPNDPICIGCGSRPEELACYTSMLEPGEDAREYVLAEEGTLNRRNGHFLCDWCYINRFFDSETKEWGYAVICVNPTHKGPEPCPDEREMFRVPNPQERHHDDPMVTRVRPSPDAG